MKVDGPQYLPPSLAPLVERFGAEVVIFCGETESERAQSVMRRASAWFFPAGRQPLCGRARVPLAGQQVYFLGDDVAAFVAAVAELRDSRLPLLPLPGLVSVKGVKFGKHLSASPAEARRILREFARVANR